MAESVFRKGARDVHHAFRGGGIEFEHDSCRLDGRGNVWRSVIPPGPRCAKCFAAYDELGAQRKGKGAGRRGPLIATAVGAAGVALWIWLWSSQGVPVTALSSPTAFAAAPSATPGLQSQTPAPSVGPEPTRGAPVPTPQIIVYRLIPVVVPVRPNPAPTPVPTAACVHPGTHLGVDPCRWPHN